MPSLLHTTHRKKKSPRSWLPEWNPHSTRHPTSTGRKRVFIKWAVGIYLFVAYYGELGFLFRPIKYDWDEAAPTVLEHDNEGSARNLEHSSNISATPAPTIAGAVGALMNQAASDQDGTELEEPNFFQEPFEIIVLTMSRADSLLRLLKSLEASDYLGDEVTLTIRIDKAKNETDNNAVISLANRFDFTHGKKEVEISPINLGLRDAWLNAWRPTSTDQKYAIILEDDLEVSPFWYRYVKQAWKTYHKRTDIAGISLNRQTLIADKRAPKSNMEIVNQHKPFFYRLVGSQGFAPIPKFGKNFWGT